MLFGGDLLVLADDTVMLPLTTGKDYYVLVVRWLTLGHTQPIHIQMFLLIYHSHSIYYCEFCFNWKAWDIKLSAWDHDSITEIVKLMLKSLDVRGMLVQLK